MPGVQARPQAIEMIPESRKVLAHILIGIARFPQFSFLVAAELHRRAQLTLGAVPVKSIPFEQQYAQVGLNPGIFLSPARPGVPGFSGVGSSSARMSSTRSRLRLVVSRRRKAFLSPASDTDQSRQPPSNRRRRSSALRAREASTRPLAKNSIGAFR